MAATNTAQYYNTRTPYDSGDQIFNFHLPMAKDSKKNFSTSRGL